MSLSNPFVLIYYKKTFLRVCCSSPHVEPVAGVVQRRSGADIGVSPLHSASGQVSDRAMQRQPTWKSAGGGRRLQAGWQSTRTVSLQGAGAGRQHNTVSTLSLIKETCTSWLMTWVGYLWLANHCFKRLEIRKVYISEWERLNEYICHEKKSQFVKNISEHVTWKEQFIFAKQLFIHFSSFFTQQTTQRRQYLQIRHSQDSPKQAQDKRLREEEKKVITSFGRNRLSFFIHKASSYCFFLDDLSCTITMPLLYSLCAVIYTSQCDIYTYTYMYRL